MPKRITKIKFYSIMRDIKDARRSNTDIATFHQVSTETVRNVKNAKTWPGYVLQKQARSSYAANAKDRKFHAAKKAGLHPGERTERKLGVELKTLEDYVTRTEFEAGLKHIHDRLDAQRSMIIKKSDRRVWPWSRR